MVFNATFNDIFYLYRGCQFYPYPISFLYCCFVVIVFVLCLVPNIARDCVWATECPCLIYPFGFL